LGEQRGSQYRETLEESGYKLIEIIDDDDCALLENQYGEREWWYKNDYHAGWTIEVNGVGYEYGRDYYLDAD
jgi:hypothetical protein